MIKAVSHIALIVPDLQKAEDFYQTIFEMELIGREARKEGGQWFSLPQDKDWEDAIAAGVDLDMTALRKVGLVLALFRGDTPPGQVFAVGLSAAKEDIKTIRDNLAADVLVVVHQDDRLEFEDPYYIRWQIAVDPVFRTAGEFADRWLEI